MYGKANVALKGINPDSSSAQNLPAGAEDVFKYALDHEIPVSITAMSGSTIGLVGAVTCEALRKPSTAIVGKIPSLNKNVSVSGGKITLTTPE